jgi:hypothetical protein
MGLLMLLHVLLVAVSARAPAAHAWGKEGHYMTCKITEVSFLLAFGVSEVLVKAE